MFDGKNNFSEYNATPNQFRETMRKEQFLFYDTELMMKNKIFCDSCFLKKLKIPNVGQAMQRSRARKKITNNHIICTEFFKSISSCFYLYEF
jgi:hypothetical protein